MCCWSDWIARNVRRLTDADCCCLNHSLRDGASGYYARIKWCSLCVFVIVFFSMLKALGRFVTYTPISTCLRFSGETRALKVPKWNLATDLVSEVEVVRHFWTRIYMYRQSPFIRKTRLWLAFLQYSESLMALLFCSSYIRRLHVSGTREVVTVSSLLMTTKTFQVFW